MNSKVQRTLPVLLSIASSIGVVATGVITGIEATKNAERMSEVYASKDKKLIIKETFKTFWPAMVAGTATIASLVTGTIISKRYEASLSATALMIDGAYHKYKGKVKQLLGKEADEKVTNEMSKDDYKKADLSKLDDGYRLYWEEHIGNFEAKPEDLAKAFNLSNERIRMGLMTENGMTTDSYSSFRVLLNDAKARIVPTQESDKPIDIDDISYDYGWSYDYLNECWDGRLFLHYDEIPVYDEKTGVILYYKLVIEQEPFINNYGRSYGLTGGYDAKQCDEEAELEEERMRIEEELFREEEDNNGN